jgi:hypothetical protein
MKPNIQDAARELLGRVQAPAGSVTISAHHDASGPLIRVMVDPLYWHAIHEVPSRFEGYRVTIERREPTVAFQLNSISLEEISLF